MPKPIPIPDELSQPFWDAANERRLVAQYCAACNDYQHPPSPKCVKCGAEALEYRELSGRGTIYSVQIVHDTRIRSMQDYQPFVLATVISEESPNAWFFTNLAGTTPEDIGVGSDPGKVTAGMQVAVDFEEIAEGRLLPQFRVVS